MNRLARALLPFVALLPAACKGCHAEEAPPMTLAQAADKAIFASVEKLGAHHYVGRVTRADSRDGREATPHEETIDLAWQDWDHFRYARLINGQPASEVIVANGVPYTRKGNGRWDQREDVEPYRVQLQSTWDTWDEALEPFGDRIQLTETGTEIIEGRPSTRYAVSLAPSPAEATPKERLNKKGKEKEKPRPASRSHFEPIALSGTVWVDQATAVRLVGDVQGSAQQGNLTRSVTLRFARSDFGLDPEIEAPPQPARARGADGLPSP